MNFKSTPSKLAVVAILSLIMVVGISQPLMAQADSVPDVKKDSTWHEWNVRLAPYVWLLGIQGQVAFKPDPAQLPELPQPPTNLPADYTIFDIDLSFQDVAHSLKFALMLSGKFNFKRVVTQFNISSLVLESDAIAPFDYIFQNNNLRMAYAGGELGIGYRILTREKFVLDLLAGMKFVYFKMGLVTELAGQRPVSTELSQFWGDPVVGMNLVYRPLRWLELIGYGDVGPTLFNSNWTYQFATSANFLITKHFYMSAGYRNYYINGPLQEISFEGSLSGFLVKFGFQF